MRPMGQHFKRLSSGFRAAREVLPTPPGPGAPEFRLPRGVFSGLLPAVGRGLYLRV